MRPVALLSLLIMLLSTSASSAPVSNITITTHAEGDGFNVNGSFVVPLSLCQAYSYLTDYDIERDIPGVISVSHSRISPHRVQLHRVLEERILFIPIQIQSVIEITEQPNRGMDFVQLSGSARSYKGQWRLEPVTNGTRFVYRAHTNPGTVFPDAMAQQVIEDSLRRNFDAMVGLAQKRQDQFQSKCAANL